jgi:hypothetical protein
LGISDNLSEYSERQENAFRKTFESRQQTSDKSLIQASKQKAAKNNPSIQDIPSKSKNLHVSHNTIENSSLNPLMARGVVVDNNVSKFSRESASRKQSKTTVEQYYQEWSKNDSTDKSSSQLFDANGKQIKRVKGEDQ